MQRAPFVKYFSMRITRLVSPEAQGGGGAAELQAVYDDLGHPRRKHGVDHQQIE
jgi:hypothetical protein